LVRTKSSADSSSIPAGLPGRDAMPILLSGLPVLKIRPANAGVASIKSVPRTTIQSSVLSRRTSLCKGSL